MNADQQLLLLSFLLEAVRRANKRTMPSCMCALHRRARSPGKPKVGCFAQPMASHFRFVS